MLADAEFIRVLGLGAMMVDHCGAVFWPECGWFRIVGRVSYPLFAWLAVLGIQRTRDLGAYLFRLIVLGLVSQAGYSLFFKGCDDLLCMAFGACLVWLVIDDRRFGALLPGLCALWGNQAALVASVPLLWLAARPVERVGLLALVNGLAGGPWQALAGFGGFLMRSGCRPAGWRLPRWFSYAVYPLHFWVLAGVQYGGDRWI